MATSILTAERLRELLDYDPDTGIFRRFVRRSDATLGRVAGGTDKDGYVQIQIEGKRWSAHRLAWLHAHGAWPEHEIDHINGRRDDNRIANLRDVTRKVNLQNRRLPKRTNRTSNSIGVSFHNGKFKARIYVNSKHVHLGTFDTEEDASLAYLAAKRTHHEGCTI